MRDDLKALADRARHIRTEVDSIAHRDDLEADFRFPALARQRLLQAADRLGNAATDLMILCDAERPQTRFHGVDQAADREPAR